MSFLPSPYSHSYEIAEKYSKSVAYFSMEFAIDQALKTYSGGLGFLAGSHMRSAYDLKQNLVGIGILWSFGYYDQVRDENREMAVAHRRKEYYFLEDHDLKFQIRVNGAHVWVKALYLSPETFGCAPMFFLTTDIPENDYLSRTITHSLYDADKLTRVAQSIVLGVGGAALLEKLDVDPEVWHLNEAHPLPAAFYEAAKYGLEATREKFVFTTHTPEEAGNEKSSLNLLRQFEYFSVCDDTLLSQVSDLGNDEFNHTLAALRVSRISNGVSRLHGEVARKMWNHHEGICPITHITNAQNKKYWADKELDDAVQMNDRKRAQARKRQLKEKLVTEVANQTGRMFDPDVLTIVWSRRFAGYKRPSLITRDWKKFEALLENATYPVQIIWAGKPYPKDYSAIDEFNQLVRMSKRFSNTAVLVGYELALSKLLKCGADIWLNNPVVTREASGTSGMTAAMNGAVNLSTDDGWVCEFARDGKNSFIIPAANAQLNDHDRDDYDCDGFYKIMHEQVLPMYYNDSDAWQKVVENSMNEVAPAFDSARMADEYYEKVYS